MPNNTHNLLDEILKSTKNYRCEYLEILVEKYVKTENEVMDINIRNCTVVKSTNHLKRMEVKRFGYVSSYDCKTAKKPVNCWKKKIILQKRASFRKYVGVKSSDEDYHFTNSKEKSNYLTPYKAYKTLLSIEKDNSCCSVGESENTLSNQTDLSDDECSTSFEEENENTESCDDSPSVLSDTVEEIQSKVFRKNETVKLLATSDKNKLLSPNNVPNFEIKNCDVNLLKSSSHKKIEILVEHFSSSSSNMYDGNVSKIKHQKMATYLKDVILSSNKKKENSASSSYSVYNNKSIVDYVSSKCIPKFKFSDIKMGISNKNCQVSDAYNVKSLLHDSNKSTKALKSATKEIEGESYDKNCQPSCNYFASNKSIEINFNKIETGTTKKDRQVSNNFSAKSVVRATKKSAEPPKFRAYENRIGTSINNCQISTDCSDKSLLYSTNKSTESFKLKVSEAEASNKASSVFNCKSLICIPNKSVESPTYRFRTKIRDKNCQTLIKSPSLKSTLVSFPLTPKLENFMSIDSLSLKKVSDDNKVHKKSLIQTSLSFQSRKKHTSYLENCKIDDLSLRKDSSPQNTPKTRRKEACKK